MNIMKMTLEDEFYPLVAETLGYWTPSNLKTLRAIASKTMTYSNISVSSFKNLRKQLSVKLCINNARLIHYCLELNSCNTSFWVFTP